MFYNDFSWAIKYILQIVVTYVYCIWCFNVHKIRFLSTLSYEFRIRTWRVFDCAMRLRSNFIDSVANSDLRAIRSVQSAAETTALRQLD